MTAESIQEKEAIEAEHGPWTAYNINLGQEIQTAPQFAVAHLRLRRVVQTIADLSTKPWKELHILDLASLEGIFALEFARHGSQVVAIEGREANNARARFAAETLGVENIEFITNDVRNLSLEKYGQFDVVLCSGLLYHLAGEEGCEFVSSIADVCSRLDDNRHARGIKKRPLCFLGRTHLSWNCIFRAFTKRQLCHQGRPHLLVARQLH